MVNEPLSMVDAEAKMTAGTVCVAILDKDSWTSNTDVMEVADLRRGRLTWVPRDLWSERLGDRINTAFAAGQLLPTLAELGFRCNGSICFRRGATIAALADLEVKRPLDFWYPLSPMQPIKAGRNKISFRPPLERLSGERLHQWIGARFAVEGPSSDLHRLARQGVLLRALIEQRADFSTVLADAELVESKARILYPFSRTSMRPGACGCSAACTMRRSASA